jgi:hypothetical protein
MNKPSGFSLSSLSVSLAKIPKTYLYAAAGAVLLGALGVVALNMLSTPAVEEFVPPAVSTPATNPGTTAPSNSSTSNSSTSNSSTSNSSNPTGTTTPSNNGSDDIGGGPSRALEVQPIPFLVTEAIKTDPNNPNGTATTQAINTRSASSAVVNPFAPLTVENTGNVGVVQNGSNPNLGISRMPITQTRGSQTTNVPPIRQTGPITVRGSKPLPQFPTAPQGSKPTQATLPPRSGSVKITPATKNTPTSVPTIPKAIANAKPAIKAPKPGVNSPSGSVALSSPAPSTPGLMRQVVPAKPAPQPVDPTPTVIPVVPTDPELTGDFAALTEPNILGGPIELREPGAASIGSPLPLDSSIPKAPVKPPVVTPDTTTPIEQPPVVVPVERVDPLTAFVNARGLSFIGVVLGPVNTAIFETKEGTVVVPLGATLPQSDVIIKTITADQVVLMQGQDTIILSRAK